MLTQEKLKEILHYNPDTGIFTWIEGRNWLSKKGYVAGSIATKGYLTVMIDGRNWRLHRLAFIYMDGKINEQVDHINHIKDDNRWCNLRSVNNKENHKNRPKNKNNKSGVIGVGYSKDRNKHVAQIMVDGKNLLLGRYKDFFEACCARKSANVKYGFHENHGL